jgi:hypothetical protein
MKKCKASSVVIGGHPAGLVLSVIRSVCHPQRRMIVCYDRYGRFQQIPFGAGVEHWFFFVYALQILLFYAL